MFINVSYPNVLCQPTFSAALKLISPLFGTLGHLNTRVGAEAFVGVINSGILKYFFGKSEPVPSQPLNRSVTIVLQVQRSTKLWTEYIQSSISCYKWWKQGTIRPIDHVTIRIFIPKFKSRFAIESRNVSEFGIVLNPCVDREPVIGSSIFLFGMKLNLI